MLLPDTGRGVSAPTLPFLRGGTRYDAGQLVLLTVLVASALFLAVAGLERDCWQFVVAGAAQLWTTFFVSQLLHP